VPQPSQEYGQGKVRSYARNSKDNLERRCRNYFRTPGHAVHLRHAVLGKSEAVPVWTIKPIIHG
jgi:hypothetical protein